MMSARLIAIRRLASVRTPVASRAFTVSARTQAEGDTGAPRSGGAAANDAFNKRGHANEEMFIKDEERRKLKALREKIAQQQKHLKELDDHIGDLEKQSGGEHN